MLTYLRGKARGMPIIYYPQINYAPFNSESRDFWLFRLLLAKIGCLVILKF